MTKQIDDGGPAFPMPSGDEPRVNTTTHYNEGMSLRDWFAGQFLVGFVSTAYKGTIPDKMAIFAYAHADAMIAARKETKA